MTSLANRLSNSKGISLIEILFSVFILSVAVVGLTRIYYLSAYQVNLSRHSVMAVNLAQARIEELLNTKYRHLDPEDFPLSQTNEDGFVLDPDESLECGMDTFLYDVGTAGYIAKVTVWWYEPWGGSGRMASQTLKTLITNYEKAGT